jgi:flagellar biosynthesis protein FlhF
MRPEPNAMRIKSYFSHTVEDALAVARQEMGADAMLVNTRRALPETGHEGEYEVVLATDAPEVAETSSPAAATPAARPPDRLSLEVSELKRELEGMRRTLAHSAFTAPGWTGGSGDATAAYAALTAAEVDPQLAREIVENAEQAARGHATGRTPQRLDSAALEQAVMREMEARFSAQPGLGRSDTAPRVAALVGPPGSGKTTTLVKLAVNYGLASRRPALLLSTDTYRIAAAEQLRSFAAILGIGFHLVETPTGLAQAIEENRGKDLILIDTPGFGSGDLDAAAELARLIAGRPDVDTHLVLPASMKAADLERMVDTYRIFGPRRLLFTKLDETGSFGPIFNQAARTGMPLSFFTDGQRIPEDLREATSRGLLELVLSGRSSAARSAA